MWKLLEQLEHTDGPKPLLVVLIHNRWINQFEGHRDCTRTDGSRTKGTTENIRVKRTSHSSPEKMLSDVLGLIDQSFAAEECPDYGLESTTMLIYKVRRVSLQPSQRQMKAHSLSALWASWIRRYERFWPNMQNIWRRRNKSIRGPTVILQHCHWSNL